MAKFDYEERTKKLVSILDNLDFDKEVLIYAQYCENNIFKYGVVKKNLFDSELIIFGGYDGVSSYPQIYDTEETSINEIVNNIFGEVLNDEYIDNLTFGIVEQEEKIIWK